MNLRKRTLALLLTLCLLLSVVVPMASAEEKTITLQLGTSFPDNWEAFDADETTAGLAPGTSTGYIRIKLLNTHLEGKQWVAIRIKSDRLEAGTTYALQLQTTQTSYAGTNDIYVIKDTAESGDALKNYVQDRITESNKVGQFNSGSKDVQDMSNVTLEGNSFILAFRPSKCLSGTNYCHFTLTNVYLTPVPTQSNVASNGSTEYATVAAAIEAAKTAEDKTVTLIDNVTEDVEVPAGITLDLNGKTLTATEFKCEGILADKSNGNGMVATMKDKTIKVADSDLLLFDSEKMGYRVYNGFTVAPHVDPEKPALQDMPNGAKRLWIKLSFTNQDAYRVIATGESDLTVGAKLVWNGQAIDKKLTFGNDHVKDWANRMAADDGKEYGFYIDFTGFDKLEPGTLTLTPFVYTVSSAASITHIHAG
jgi:hypothetical protein